MRRKALRFSALRGLRVLGADVRPVPPKPYKDDDNYQKIAGHLAADIRDDGKDAGQKE